MTPRSDEVPPAGPAAPQLRHRRRAGDPAAGGSRWSAVAGLDARRAIAHLITASIRAGRHAKFGAAGDAGAHPYAHADPDPDRGGDTVAAGAVADAVAARTASGSSGSSGSDPSADPSAGPGTDSRSHARTDADADADPDARTDAPADCYAAATDAGAMCGQPAGQAAPALQAAEVRRFLLRRRDDPDAAGSWVVAEGVVSDGGWVALFWGTVPRSVSMYQSLEDVMAIHGPPRVSTVIEYLDESHTQRVVRLKQEGERRG